MTLELVDNGIGDPGVVALAAAAATHGVLERCKEILTKCDTISYAPISSASDVLTDIQLAGETILELERELK